MGDVPGTAISALAADQLAQINRVATAARFVSGLTHDLNNSLQIMSGLVELLSDRHDLPPDVLVRLGRIGEQADQASAKIRQVAGYVRETGRPDERLDFGSLVDRALTLRSYELGRAGIAVTWGSPLERFPVRGNARDLHQAILNMLANAQEALAGAEVRDLLIALDRTEDTVRLSVADTGPGVPPELRDRIFEPFFTTRAASGAIGLGLAVAAHTAAVHGGRLSLAGTGPGAEFVLELPLDGDGGDGEAV
jgi:signal transduction histidine kinase